MTTGAGDLGAAAQAVVAGLSDDDDDPGPVLRALRELRIPAVSVALVRGGRIDAARAWGSRTPDGQEAATTSTRFLAGSISKPVTATAALRLVDDGVLDLDEDLDARLVGWHVEPLGDWQPTVTLRQLLSHTAGTTVHGFPGYPRTEPAPDTRGVLRGEGNTPAVVVDSLPGVRWRYSGGGTTVVQLLIEEVTGRSFADVLRDLVLEPVGMTTATFEQPPPERLHPLLAEGTDAEGTPIAGGWHVYPEMAAAGLWCTPSDLAQWVVAVQQARAGAPGALLSAGLTEQMLREQAPGWGLGPHVSRAGEHPRFGHGGADEGFLASIEAGQQDGTGVVVMASSNAAGPLINAIVTAVAQAQAWPDFPVPPADAAALLAGYAGAWLLDDGRELRVEATADGLVLHLPGQRPLPLSPTSASLWGTRVGMEVEFALEGADRTPSSLTLRPAGALTARRAEPLT
jgi:CubicO group peptidase (beta-lactamase class C family)